MFEKELNLEKKNKNMLKLNLNNDGNSEDDDKKIKNNNPNKNKSMMDIKTFKEDNNSSFNNFNLNTNLNKEENTHEYNSSDYTNEKEITIGKLYSYRRPYSKYRRKLIFLLICIINILINCDHGAIPAGTTELKEAKNLSNIQLGTIGSLVYLGLVLGSISGGYIFSTYSSKWVIINSLIAACIFLYFFTVSNYYLSMAFCRVGCGFFQVFCYIYFPIWVDQFGVNNTQTLWLTFLQLGVPIGTMIGYLTEACSNKFFHNWQGAFYVQIFNILICIILLFITPDKFFSKNYRHSESTQEEIKSEFNDLKELINKKLGKNSNKYLLKNMTLINNVYDSKYGRPSLYSIFSMVDEVEEEGQQKYCSAIKELIFNKKYMFTMLGISCLLFVVTGIQFWISDYMREVMNISSSKVYIIFSIVCITAPTLGVLSGGFFIQYLGGYTNKMALDACFKISIIAAGCGIFLPFFDITVVFVIFMWLLLFFGGSITPGLTGIMIASIPENSKEIGNSLSQLFYNLIGYLPSPFIYGLVCKYTGGSKSRWGLGILVLWGVFGVICLYFAKKFEFEIYGEENEYNLENEENIKELFLKNNEEAVNDNISKRKLSRKNTGELPITKYNFKEKSKMITKLFGRISNV